VLPRSARLGEHTRRIATYAGVILITDGAFTLFNQVDVLIIGAYLGAGAVGFFSGPVRLIAFLGYPGGAIATGVSPLLARGPQQEPDKPAFLSALRLVLIVQGAFTAFVLGWSDLIVRVTLGSHYTKSVDVLRALAPFVFMLGFGPLVSGAVNYLGEARRRVPVAIATALVNLVVDLLLVPRIGVVGGSVGTDVAYGIYAPAHLYICQRALALDLRAPARTLVRTLAAMAASAGVLLACGDSLSEPWWIALGGVAAVATYGGVLWLTRELTPREAVELLRQLRGMRRAQPAGADS
jgi:O-antigen/teichoic acid export membrane protein